MTQTKTATAKKAIAYSESLLVDSRQAGIPAFPATPTIAKKNFEQLLAEKLQDGWVYHGEVSQNIGPELRRYWVFYR